MLDTEVREVGPTFEEIKFKATEIFASINAPVVGRQIHLRENETIEGLIRDIEVNTRNVIGSYDLGVSPFTSCVIESIRDVTRYDDRPGVIVNGNCRSPVLNSRRFTFIFNESTNEIYTRLGSSGSGIDTFYGSPATLEVRQIEDTSYVIAFDVDSNAATREHLTGCESAGGEVRGAIGYQWCTLLYSDGGKSCNDSSECEGFCVPAPREQRDDARAAGVCEADSGNPGSCLQTIESGLAGLMMCP
jgi:hypothetical protein